MNDATLGRVLRQCRESVKPTFTQRDLADCILSSLDPQKSRFTFSGDADALALIINGFESKGQWALPRDLLGPFINECAGCLDPRGVAEQPFATLAWGTVCIVFGDDPPNDGNFVIGGLNEPLGDDG